MSKQEAHQNKIKITFVSHHRTLTLNLIDPSFNSTRESDPVISKLLICIENIFRKMAFEF